MRIAGIGTDPSDLKAEMANTADNSAEPTNSRSCASCVLHNTERRFTAAG
jgi:hypothetical protein